MLTKMSLSHNESIVIITVISHLNTLRPRQDGRHFPDDIFKCIFLNENVWIPIKISLKFVPKGPINNIPALVQIMAWRCPGDKPLSEPMMFCLTTHIFVTEPQWVNIFCTFFFRVAEELACIDRRSEERPKFRFALFPKLYSDFKYML